MTSKSKSSPIFPMPEPQHFSDYGFDPQLGYFQVLEEAMKHKKETSFSSSSRSTIDTLHFKLQKPIISKDHHHHHHHDKINTNNNKIHKKKKRKWWWANVLLLFKWKGRGGGAHNHHHHHHHEHSHVDDDVHYARAQAFRASISGPVYITESRSGSNTPYRTSSGPVSVGGCTPTRKGSAEIPYLSLRELNLEQKQRVSASSSSSMPIYLVT